MFLYVVTIEGSSMNPTLKEGDRVLVLRRPPIRFLRKSQIVVLDLSKAAFLPAPKPKVVIKRLVGLPGDTVLLPISQVDQSVVFADIAILRDDGHYEFQVPPAHCFVRADGHGSDSRHWGPIPLYAMVGVVIRRMSILTARKDENESA